MSENSGKMTIAIKSKAASSDVLFCPTNSLKLQSDSIRKM